MAFVIPIGWAIVAALGTSTTVGVTTAYIIKKSNDEQNAKRDKQDAQKREQIAKLELQLAKLRAGDYMEVDYELIWYTNGRKCIIKKSFKGKKRDFDAIYKQDLRMVRESTQY